MELALWSMSARFDETYSRTGRPSIQPEKLLRAQLLQMLYSIRSERLLMEEIDYSVLFRWFVGMNMDEPVRDVTVFTKNRDRLLDGGRGAGSQGQWQGSQTELQRQPAGRESQRVDHHDRTFQANGTAERDAALVMLEHLPGGKRVTAGTDKAKIRKTLSRSAGTWL